MTKKKKLILIFSIIGAVILAATATVLIILLSKKKPEEETKKVQCVAPEITVLDDGIYWANVENAESYYYNYNAGEWTEAKEVIAFPTSTGEYSLQLKAVDADGNDGKITTFAFKVAKMTVECERVDNALHFTGERIYYSVNGMEEGTLTESNILDFSNDTFGTKYTVAYYAKGGYYSQENNTYYLDSEKQTQELTTTQMLTMPTLRVNEAGTHLVWTTSSNAVNYAVSVDGEKTTVSNENASVAFPMTLGEHTITVQAVGDGQSWYSSLQAEYKMTTKRESVPAITYEKATNRVAWAENYTDKIRVSTDGSTYASVNSTSVAVDTNTSLKVSAYYDEAQKTYYLESKPTFFVKREVSALSFNIDGYVKWNDSDDELAKQYYLSIVEQSTNADYVRLNENVKNISFLEPNAYTLTVYAAEYVAEQADKVIFYLPSESQEIDFAVLKKPTLSFETGKLLWEVDAHANSYEYRVNGIGEWETATEIGVLRTRDMATYEVRAVGSQEQGKYALTSGISSLLFDPELEVAWDEGQSELAIFNNELYSKITSSATSANSTKTGSVQILTAGTGADSAEQAILAGADGGVLKVTAGTSKPKFKAYWGNSDGATIQLFTPITPVAGARIIFRVYIVPNENRKTATAYNYSGECTNVKGRTIDDYGNTYAFFDQENNLVGYQSTTDTLIDGTGEKIGTIDTKSRVATVTETGAKTKARTIYGILDDNDNLLGVADENGVVKNGDTVVGTLNEKGELIVDGVTLSTSAVRKTSNMEGRVIVGVVGNKVSGGFGEHETWYTKENTALPVGEWTEVSFTITKDYANNLADISYVYLHLFANGQAGDTFYIDEIRYDENPQKYSAPAYWQCDGDVGADSYTIAEFSWFKPTVTSGTDEHGEYIDFDWTGCESGWGVDALTFYFKNLTLNEGDTVYIRCNAYTGRWSKVYANDEANWRAQIICNDVTGGALYQEKLCFTATNEMQLTTLSIRPDAWKKYDVHFRIYGVYVVRAESSGVNNSGSSEILWNPDWSSSWTE